VSVAAEALYSFQLSDTDLHITPAARSKMAELLTSMEEDVEAIRVFVGGGGCGGMSYGMTYADQVTEYDSVIDGEGFKVVIDPVALNYLKGAEIDFLNDAMNPSFVFNNVFRSVGGGGGCGGCGGGGGCGAR